MALPIQAPVTHALAEGLLTRRELKTLMRRKDAPAFGRLCLWAAVLAGTSLLTAWSAGSPWFAAAMSAHGVVVVHHFSLQHECAHYTVFKTRPLNDIIGAVCGFITMIPQRFFRYEHCDHHNHTQIPGKDPELINLPRSVWAYIWYLSGLPYWYAHMKALLLHSAGRLGAGEDAFIPRTVRSEVFNEARVHLALYALIAGLSTVNGWAWPLWFWVLPSLLGQPVMRAIRMTEHVGRPNVLDQKTNTRTSLVSPPLRFLCWNMNHHAEHHYAPSVPFHALPELHKKLAGHVYVEPKGYIGAHADILRQVLNRAPVTPR